MSQTTETLQEWIAAATSGLPESAAEKFAAEIRDHAAEARQKHIAAGMPEAEADRAALAGLGDAGDVARTFRDAHFSRREYARGALAAAAVLALGLAGMALDTASAATPAMTPNWAGWWGGLLRVVSGFGGAALLVMVARAGLSFLREQLDAPAPRWASTGLIGAIAAANVLSGLVALAQWVTNLGPLASRLDWLNGLNPVLMLAGQLLTMAAGGLIAFLCVRGLRSGRARPAALLLGAAGGLEMALLSLVVMLPDVSRYGYYLSRAQSIGEVIYAIPGFATLGLVELAMVAPLIALLGLLLALFDRLRRPGAALTA